MHNVKRKKKIKENHFLQDRYMQIVKINNLW